MKAGELFKTFADEDLKTAGVRLKIGGVVEITLEEARQLAKDADALCSMRFKVGLASVDSKGRGVVEMSLRKDTFDLDGVEMPPEEPATEPMIGPDGQVIGDVVDGIVGGLSVVDVSPELREAAGSGPAPGEGFDALEAKPKRGKKAAEPKRCPHPNCLKPEEHDGDHEFPTEDPNE